MLDSLCLSKWISNRTIKTLPAGKKHSSWMSITDRDTILQPISFHSFDEANIAKCISFFFYLLASVSHMEIPVGCAWIRLQCIYTECQSVRIPLLVARLSQWLIAYLCRECSNRTGDKTNNKTKWINLPVCMNGLAKTVWSRWFHRVLPSRIAEHYTGFPPPQEAHLCTPSWLRRTGKYRYR